MVISNDFDSLFSLTRFRTIMNYPQLMYYWGRPWWLSGKESACQCRRCKFDLRVGNISWRRKWKPTPVFLLGNSVDRGTWQATVHEGCKESDKTEQLTRSLSIIRSTSHTQKSLMMLTMKKYCSNLRSHVEKGGLEKFSDGNRGCS